MDKSELFKNQYPFKPGTRFIFTLSTLIIITLSFSVSLLAQGDLIIFPKRVVFEGTQRFHELNLANSGRDTARYIISFVQIRMKEDGGFENITKPDSGQNFADGFLRIFPRTVTLAPGEAQLLKIQLTKTDLLTPGEYRSHLYFRSSQERKPLSLGEKDSVKDTTAISVRLVPIYGMTIPVIIRVGDNTTQVSISDLSFIMIETDLVPHRLTVVAVAAAILVVFFVPLPDLSLFNRLTVTSPTGAAGNSGPAVACTTTVRCVIARNASVVIGFLPSEFQLISGDPSNLGAATVTYSLKNGRPDPSPTPLYSDLSAFAAACAEARPALRRLLRQARAA